MLSPVIPLRQTAVESAIKLAAFDQLALPALCINASGQVLAANRALFALLALPDAPHERVVGHQLGELLGYRNRYTIARRWSLLWERLQRDHVVSQDIALRLFKGCRVALRLVISLLQLEQDTVAYVMCEDITRERALARTVQQARTQHEVLEHAFTDLTLLIGADRRVLGLRVHDEGCAGMLRAADVTGVPLEYLLDETSAREFVGIFEQFRLGRVPRQRSALWRLRPTPAADAGGAELPGQQSAADSKWFAIKLENRLSDARLRAVVVTANDASELVEQRSRALLLQQRLQTLAHVAVDLMMVLDAQGRIRFQSDAIARTLGQPAQDTLGRAAVSLLLPDYQPALQAAIRAAAHEHDAQRAHTALGRCATVAGSVRTLWFSVRNCSDDPSVDGLLVTATDVTGVDGAADAAAATDGSTRSRRLAFREQLLELAIDSRADFSESLLRVLRASASMAGATAASFWRHSTDPEELRCDAYFDARTGRTLPDWIDAGLSAVAMPAYFAALARCQPLVFPDVRAQSLLGAISEDKRWSAVRARVDVPVILRGEVKGMLSVQHNEPRNWDEDDVNFFTTAALLIALAMEASQRQAAETRVEQLAWYDALTGLPNRNLLRETLRDMLMTAATQHRRVAIMLIDLDRFKDVNDTLGHLVGDSLIRAAGRILKETVGESGVCARLGGDEFVVLLDAFTHRQEVALLAARIAQALHRTDIVANIDTQVSASVGIALFPEHGREISTLLKNADAAMYQAKRDGRNQFSFFNPIRHEHASREVQLGIELMKALQNDSAQFAVEYQPQVEVVSGKVVGLEALIRWHHPAFGRLTPDNFIGVAEVSGLSERVSRWVINEVCAQIARWRQVYPAFDIPVAINVAGREMGATSLPALVRTSLQRHAIEPRMIRLEITERTLVREGEVNNDVMGELAALGVGLVLDDFGTGYSMLGYLKRMPIQAFKIDRSFIEGLPRDADSCAIVMAMLSIARHFKLGVIAEGIETQVQLDYLRSIGCEYAQGFLFSRPLSAQALVEFIRGQAIA